MATSTHPIDAIVGINLTKYDRKELERMSDQTLYHLAVSDESCYLYDSIDQLLSDMNDCFDILFKNNKLYWKTLVLHIP